MPSMIIIKLIYFYTTLFYTILFHILHSRFTISFQNNMTKNQYAISNIDPLKENKNKNVQQLLDNIQHHDIILLHGFDNIVYYKEKIVINNQKPHTFFVGKLIDFAGQVMNIRFTYKDISKIFYRDKAIVNFYEKSMEFNGYYPKIYDEYLSLLRNNDVVEIFNQKEVIRVRIMDLDICDQNIMYSKCYGTIINQLDQKSRYNIFSEIVFNFSEIINFIRIGSKTVHINDENLIYQIIHAQKKKRNFNSINSAKMNEPTIVSNVLQHVHQ